MERSLLASLGILALLAPPTLGVSGCMSHTRGDDAGVELVDAHEAGDAPFIHTPCDGCFTPRDAPVERICGGLAELETCLPSEFCDYPDGSFCGGDDSTGVCRPRPTDCSEPGGVPACGCDGVEYLFDCNAYLAGTDIREYGPCVTTHAYDTAMAERSCAPADGPAWTITLTTDREDCTLARDDGSLALTVWHDLERAAPGTAYRLGADLAGDGQAAVCGRPGDPCASAEGTIVFHVFAAGEVARFDFDVRTADGRRFAETNVEIARFWCHDAFPGCG